MTNIHSVHERLALKLLGDYADNKKQYRNLGTIKWIEPNDESFRISWGRVTKVCKDFFLDGSGTVCEIDVISDKDGKLYDCCLLRDESEEDQQKIVELICHWIEIPAI